MVEKRSHWASSLRRKRRTQGASSETPTILPKWGLSLCHPIPAPGRYSLISTWANASGGARNAATFSRSPVSHSGWPVRRSPVAARSRSANQNPRRAGLPDGRENRTARTAAGRGARAKFRLQRHRSDVARSGGRPGPISAERVQIGVSIVSRKRPTSRSARLIIRAMTSSRRDRREVPTRSAPFGIGSETCRAAAAAAVSGAGSARPRRDRKKPRRRAQA